MRATKAYMAGLGTTGVLLVASLLLFLSVSALVGFDAWPGGTDVERVERMVVSSGEEPIPVSPSGAGAAGGEPAAPAAAVPPAAPGADAGPPAGGAPAGGGTPQVLGDRGAGGAPRPGAPDSGGAAPEAPGGGVAEVPGIDAADPETARTLLADTTEDISGDLAAAAGQVSPELGGLVGRLGSAVADQLRALPLTKRGG